MKSINYLIIFLFLFYSCKKDDDASSFLPDNFIGQEFPIIYNSPPPADKLPWPHHNPEINSEQYEKMISDIFIINNFGQYQCGDTKESCYFHDALDVILDNGTPIFALEDGVVKANIGGDEYYRTLIIEDMDKKDFGWGYTHINDFAVRPLDTVEQGQYLGRVNFKGLEHIHLQRVRKPEGGSWNDFSGFLGIYPDDFFVFKDESAPIIETPFQFYKNNSDERFEHGEVDTISGEVDIVVRMRDIGKYANADLGGGNIWGDRLCVKKINYRIKKGEETIMEKTSFDFSKMEFRFSQERWREVAVVFKHHLFADPNHSDFNSFFSNYIITNTRENLSGEINPDDANLSWNTLEINELNEFVFPNGEYEIEVETWDSKGNFATEKTIVYLLNE